ncbi:MAG: hypothetical protein SGJ19_25645 [Planctomycetia bacterium]|nr:hypothetical protein [Planctomycetia bacterium]
MTTQHAATAAETSSRRWLDRIFVTQNDSSSEAENTDSLERVVTEPTLLETPAVISVPVTEQLAESQSVERLPVVTPIFDPQVIPVAAIEALPPPTASIAPGGPTWLRAPDAAPLLEPITPPVDDFETSLFRTPSELPPGYTGPSGVLPSEYQQSSHFVPVEDRWRAGFMPWDRYGRGHPLGDDYPYKEGNWWDPYNQNVMKGDYPLWGQHTFMNITAASLTLLERRQVPTATTPFESTHDPFQEEFFGNPNQFFFQQYTRLSVSVFHGDASFKPMDWQVKLTPVFNANYLDANELAVTDPDVRNGRFRGRDDWALEEWFVETKLADLSPNYDFMSVRAGSQPFVSDFRGFVFSDINRGVRLFGTRLSNRDQFNLIWFDETEKDTNSQLNTFDDRHQNVVIANYYRQDCIWPGYTTQLSFHYNRDKPSEKFDDNDFLVRPDPAGVYQKHEVSAYYLGWAGNGHINRVNVSHAFYWALGQDSMNPIAGQKQDINAQMAALELSYDRDWARFRASAFWASGDNDVFDGEAEGFDAIFDNPNFAGGEFSYWNRQAIQLFGVNLVNRLSIVPNLRSSKTQGQANFVNPGLYLCNLGFDADLTPKLKMISNVNFLWFQETEVLQQFTFQDHIDTEIGTDLSLGLEWRPLLNNNILIIGGVSGLLPGPGFEDLYNPLRGDVDGLFASFMDIALTY